MSGRIPVTSLEVQIIGVATTQSANTDHLLVRITVERRVSGLEILRSVDGKLPEDVRLVQELAEELRRQGPGDLPKCYLVIDESKKVWEDDDA